MWKHQNDCSQEPNITRYDHSIHNIVTFESSSRNEKPFERERERDREKYLI